MESARYPHQSSTAAVTANISFKPTHSARLSSGARHPRCATGTFHDLPVYRLTREAYYKARDKHVESTLFPPGTIQAVGFRKMAETDPDSLAGPDRYMRCNASSGFDRRRLHVFQLIRSLGLRRRELQLLQSRKPSSAMRFGLSLQPAAEHDFCVQ